MAYCRVAAFPGESEENREISKSDNLSPSPELSTVHEKKIIKFTDNTIVTIWDSENFTGNFAWMRNDRMVGNEELRMWKVQVS
jgi:hypothetical protein